VSNRFRETIPNAIPWRERRQYDALVDALVAHGATDAEAIDVLAADRERLRKECADLLMLRPLPSIVLQDSTAVAIEREACRVIAVREGIASADMGHIQAASACEAVANAIAARARK
jgi:hypothetical protein